MLCLELNIDCYKVIESLLEYIYFALYIRIVIIHFFTVDMQLSPLQTTRCYN